MAQKQIGKVVLGDVIGEGGMGKVYRAHQLVLDRDVAVKVIRPDLAAGDWQKRFMLEAQTVARLTHPGIVQVYDVMTDDDGTYYLVMELVEGFSLEALLRDAEPWPAARAVAIGTQVADALQYVHARDIVHRDLKPANILVDMAGRARLMDFGIALIPSAPVKTRTGDVMGTPQYLAPEVIRGEKAGPAADQYALGMTLYRVLTGRLPFSGGTPATILLHQLQTPVPAVREIKADVPAELEAVILKSLAKNPEDRYPTAEAFGQALRASVDGSVAITTALSPATMETLTAALGKPLQAVSAPDWTAPSPAAPTTTARSGIAEDTLLEQARATDQAAALPGESLAGAETFAPRPRVPAAPSGKGATPEPAAIVIPATSNRRRARHAALALMLLAAIAAGVGFLRERSRRVSAPIAAPTTVVTEESDLERANRHWDKQEFDQAASLYLEVFKKDPLNPVALKNLSEYAALREQLAAPDTAGLLALLNWSDYIGRLTALTFAREWHLTVRVQPYAKLEEIHPAVDKGGLDVIIVPEGILAELIQAGKLLKLDHEKIPNVTNISPFLRATKFDPKNEHSLPYVYGTIGILYNTASFSAAPDSWNVLFEPTQLAGKRVVVPNYPREILGLALKYKGYSYNSINPTEIAEAEAVVKSAAASWEIVNGDAEVKKRVTGGADLVLMWNGLAATLMRTALTYQFVNPKEGSNLGFDSLAIPAGSSNVEAAHHFINHVLRGDIGAEIADALGYASPNTAARELLGDKALANTVSYPPMSVLAVCEFDTDPSAISRLFDQTWNQLVVAQEARRVKPS
ncbi:MAG: extracellular solute-binding protein [Candidatus Schekmanbacteria bacterium]|nr:extracellular solute-binding protein [Candidatus Schekmanbacteria bacterium]